MALGAKFQVGDFAKKHSDTVLRDPRSEQDLLINGGKKKDTPSNPSSSGANAPKNVRF